MSRRSKNDKKVKKGMFQSIIITLVIIISLVVIYKFNFSTKSEMLKKRAINFKEMNSENLVMN